jgi:subtilase family serine protease
MSTRTLNASRKHNSQPAQSRRWQRRATFESLEPRAMMSANPYQLAVSQPVLLAGTAPAQAAGSPAAAVGGAALQTQFTVGTLRNAYGLNRISFGSTPANGRGQTVAIIVAGDDPYLGQEISTFDNAMGLPSFNLSVVREYYGGKAPATASNAWLGETAMDVELVHAFAPGANVVLYEANPSDPVGLYQCVDWARNAPGVSVVSMSWATNVEVAGEPYMDGLFTTPSGHTGVTFVAAAGDHGVPCYPSASPNVLSVGGTKLYTQNGGYYTETVWNDGTTLGDKQYWSTGGGYSKREWRPAYQNGFQNTQCRGTVDVALDAEANSVWIYSVADGGGRYAGGGTSAATPEMAAIVAVANQGRAMAGRGSFYGVNSALYALPSSDFHDVTSGHNGYYYAGQGWDPVTGRGSPVADLMIRDLVYSSYWATPAYNTNYYVGVAAMRQSFNNYFKVASAPASPVKTDSLAGHVVAAASGGDSLRSVAQHALQVVPPAAIACRPQFELSDDLLGRLARHIVATANRAPRAASLVDVALARDAGLARFALTA